MVFIGLLLFSLFLYIRRFRVSAVLIFFFFITSGFNLVPDEFVDLGTPLTKSTDYAFFLLLGFLSIGLLFIKNFFKIDTFTKILIILFSFLFLCIVYNIFIIRVPIGEIIRTVRYLFFWLAFFVFRSLSKEELENLLKILFSVTAIISVIYLFQIVIGENILVETVTGKTSFLGIEFKRFYNQPALIYFCSFYALYNNPFKGGLKFLTIVIIIAALFGAFHRNIIGFFFISVGVGFLLRMSTVDRLKILSVGGILILLIVVFLGSRFVKSRTFIDIQTVMTQDISEVDIDFRELDNATFTFRIAHLFERNESIKENPLRMLFGAALLTEDSRMVDKMFDFQVGVVEEITSEIVQIDTGDISYSFLLLRYGYLGTLINLLPFLYFFYYFYRNKENNWGFFSLLYLVMIFGASFFSSNLIIPSIFLMPMLSMLIIQKTKEENG